MTSLPYQTALVTGASSGIGKALAYELAKKGIINIILTARTESKLKVICKDLSETYNTNATYIVCDLAEANAPQLLYDQIKAYNLSVDLLINNAGIGKWTNFLDQNRTIYQQMIRLNINSLVELCHLFLPNMLANKHGGIINIASTGALQPCPFIAVYCATKSFVLNFSESLYGEYQNKGITVTAICPGNTATNFQKTAQADTTGMKYQSAEEVASQSINSLIRRKNNHIIGFGNQIQALLPRLLPRKTIIRIVKNMMNKRVIH